MNQESGRYTCLANKMDEEGWITSVQNQARLPRQGELNLLNGATNTIPLGSKIHAALQTCDLGYS